MKISTKITITLSYLISLFVFASCEKSNTYFEDFNPQTNVYDGDIFSYIESKPGVYDSLVVILDRLPAIKDSLRSHENDYTLFAINNRSIELALASLNNVRKQSNKAPLYLEDLAIDELEHIVCRYIFKGNVHSDSINELKDGTYIYGLKYGYQMHAQYNETAATGLVGFGPQEIIFSDTNSSIFHLYWVRTNTVSINVKTDNGLVHMLTPGHDFGFNKFITAFNN